MKKLKLWRMLSCRRRAEGSITLAEAVEIAARYNLEHDVIYCVKHQGMTPYEALVEWDLLGYRCVDEDI